MNPEAFDEYMTLRLIGAPKSMFQGIEKLPPGTFSDLRGRRHLRGAALLGPRL